MKSHSIEEVANDESEMKNDSTCEKIKKVDAGSKKTKSQFKKAKHSDMDVYFKQANDSKVLASMKDSPYENNLKSNMVCQHLFLVINIAEKLMATLPFASNTMFKELVAAGNLGLVSAAKHYNPGSKAKFGTYSFVIIYRAMLHCLSRNFPILYSKGKKMKEKIVYVSLLEKDLDQRESNLCEINSLDEYNNRVFKEIFELNVFQFIKNLSPDDQLILCTAFGCFSFPKMSAKEVAEILNIGVDEVYKRRAKLIKILRETFSQKG